MTTTTNNRILEAARDAWLAAADFRHRRDRYKRYTYGDQWSDIVTDHNGFQLKEADLIARHGRKPLTNNMIRQIVKTVIGRYRSTSREDGSYSADSQRRSFIADNSLLELDCRMLEEFLISGCAVQRIARERRRGVSRLWIDNVDPRCLFVNAFRDPRGTDIELIGMTHDMSFPEVVHRFGGHDLTKIAELSHVFSSSAADRIFPTHSSVGETDSSFDDFFTAPPGRCRVIEVWTLDCRNSLICHDSQEGMAYKLSDTDASRASLSNLDELRRRTGGKGVTRRSSVDFVWRCRWFAPDGTLLAAYDSPYAHRSHPFALKLYPLTDGEVHSFVEDVIDQQRCINRMIVLIDHIIGSSAKGVLLFPQNQKPSHVDWLDIADAWSRADGVIPITGNAPHLPTQIVASTKDLGAYELLSLQMKLFDNISGVSDVIAGRNISPSTASSVYESQLRNSVVALADLIDTFASFRSDRDLKAENS